jgi:hypothetical protein
MLNLTYSQKSLLATGLLVIAFLQLTVIAMALGKVGSFSPDTRRRLTMFHRFEGYVGLLIILWVAYNCIFNIVHKSGMPRVVIHMIMGATVLGLITSKITISRGLRQYYRRLPMLGAALFTVIPVLWVTSAGWYIWVEGINP